MSKRLDTVRAAVAEQLREAQANVAAHQVAIDANVAAKAHPRAAMERARQKLAELDQNGAVLYAKLLTAERERVAIAEIALETYNIEVSSETVKAANADPIGNQALIDRNLTWLRRAVRDGLDTPISSAHKQHPVIALAMRLQPVISNVDRSMYALGGVVDGKTDWTSRRRELLDEITRDVSVADEAPSNVAA